LKLKDGSAAINILGLMFVATPQTLEKKEV
jgi:hypothetical protein